MAVVGRVTTPSGETVQFSEGRRLVFGRGPDADLVISAGRGLSRRAGMITALAGGAWGGNLSPTHTLYAATAGTPIPLPRLEEPREPRGGWVIPARIRPCRSLPLLDQ